MQNVVFRAEGPKANGWGRSGRKICLAELAAIAAEVSDFISRSAIPIGGRVLEFGCGEGYIGELVAQSGLSYVGVDVAPAAVAKAEERLRPFAGQARAMVGDALDDRLLAGERFDAAVDNGCLHMFVTDADRTHYLANLRRLLRPGSPMLFREIIDPKAFGGPVGSYEQWLAISGTNVDKPEPREAWADGQCVEIMLPCIAARARSEPQYCRELESAGFGVTEFRSSNGLCVMNARCVDS